MVQVVILNRAYVLGNYEMTLFAKQEVDHAAMFFGKDER